MSPLSNVIRSLKLLLKNVEGDEIVMHEEL